MRLVRVELRRVVARTLVMVAVLGALAGVGAVVFGTWSTTRPLSEAQLRDAEAAYQWSVEDWEENGEQYMADCLEQLELERQAVEDAGGDPDGVYDYCADSEPRRENYIPQSPELETVLPMQIYGITTLLMFVALAIGTTATAAEMSTGAMSTWLTFVPQRMRVFGSKVLAPTLFVIPVVVVLLAVHLGAVWFIHDSQGLADGMTAAIWTDTAWSAARVVAVAAVVTAIGAALGLLLRHTAAVLGAVLGWFILVEGMLVSMVQQLRPLSLVLSIQAWVNDGALYWVNTCTVTDQGTSCTGVEETLSLVQASIQLGAVAVVLIGVSALVFRRRDVG